MRQYLRKPLHVEGLESRLLLAADVATLTQSDGSMPNADVGVPAYVAGDANRDGRFDQADIVDVLQSGKYLSGEPAVWSEGDWNSDNVFDQLDIVMALKSENYVTAPFAAAAERQVPFKASGEGRVLAISDDGLTFSGELAGNATHLGKIEGTFVNSIFAQDVDSEGNVILIADSVLEMTAADGATINFRGPIEQTVIDAFGSGPFVISTDVDGGSGRFEGATGSVVFVGFFNAEVGTVTFEGDGTISSVGSLK